MNTIFNERIYCFDVDDTLVQWSSRGTFGEVYMTDPVLEESMSIVPNLNNIRLLKEKRARGCFIIVWSQGGARYAEAVIAALKLSDHVDLILTKPSGIIDDKDPNEWLPKRIWLDPNTRYKT